MNHDLTIGQPSAVLRNFCLPLFGSVIFQQMYNLADSFVAGKFIGENALAAVGNSYELTLIYIAVAFGCNIGCSVIVSHYFGARQFNELKTAIHTTYISSALLCLFLTATGLYWSGELLSLIHTPDEIMADSRCYLDIYIMGVPFVLFYNIATGIFAALGDSRTPFIFLVVSSCSNIAADIIFVKALNMGIPGLAWATFICQGISCLAALFTIHHRLKSFQGISHFFDFNILKKIAQVAIPSIFQQGFISVGNIIIQSDINTFGPGVIAGYSAAVKLNNLVVTSFTTFGNGISNFTAQNIGAKKNKRISEGFHAGLKMTFSLCIPIAILYFWCAPQLIRFFLDNPTEKALQTGVIFLRILTPFYLTVATKLVADGILRGARQMNLFMIATFTDLILRVVLAKLFSPALNETGIWCAWPFGWIIATAMSLKFYQIVKDKLTSNCN